MDGRAPRSRARGHNDAGSGDSGAAAAPAAAVRTQAAEDGGGWFWPVVLLLVLAGAAIFMFTGEAEDEGYAEEMQQYGLQGYQQHYQQGQAYAPNGQQAGAYPPQQYAGQQGGPYQGAPPQQQQQQQAYAQPGALRGAPGAGAGAGAVPSLTGGPVAVPTPGAVPAAPVVQAPAPAPVAAPPAPAIPARAPAPALPSPKGKGSSPKIDSTKYWERRYAKGQTSGGGSYGKRAVAKAVIVNAFLDKVGIQSAVEWGFGDGNQLTLIHYPKYTGLDISPTILRKTSAKFAHDPTKTFRLYSPNDPVGTTGVHEEMAISLEVIFHLTEGEVFENYMRNLFASAIKYVVICSSNKNEAISATHVRHWKVLDYAAHWFPEWHHFHTEKFPYPEIMFSDFFFFCNTQVPGACPNLDQQFVLSTDYSEADRTPV